MQTKTATHPIPARLLQSPWWVRRLSAAWAMRRVDLEDHSIEISVGGDEIWRLVRLRVARASQLPAEEFQALAERAYLAIAGQINAAPQQHGVRFWNYIPDIHRQSGSGLERYMVFNAGRFAACRRWLEHGNASFETYLPTASAVGHDGPDLYIDALACKHAGRAIENPRQVPSYRYSRRFGPLPPCFARATRLDGEPESKLLVGGTASIVGEYSVHHGNLPGQIDETLANLASLVNAGFATQLSESEALSRFVDLRIYHVPSARAEDIRARVGDHFRGVGQIEYVPAQLCRSELLVEIEGVAQ